jgi:hypothetical protein
VSLQVLVPTGFSSCSGASTVSLIVPVPKKVRLQIFSYHSNSCSMFFVIFLIRFLPAYFEIIILANRGFESRSRSKTEKKKNVPVPTFCISI